MGRPLKEESSCPRRHKACRGVLSGPVMPVTAEGHGEGFDMIADGKLGQSIRVRKNGLAERSNPPPSAVYGWLAGWLAGAAKLKSARNMINHIE